MRFLMLSGRNGPTCRVIWLRTVNFTPRKTAKISRHYLLMTLSGFVKAHPLNVGIIDVSPF